MHQRTFQITTICLLRTLFVIWFVSALCLFFILLFRLESFILLLLFRIFWSLLLVIILPFFRDYLSPPILWLGFLSRVISIVSRLSLLSRFWTRIRSLLTRIWLALIVCYSNRTRGFSLLIRNIWWPLVVLGTNDDWLSLRLHLLDHLWFFLAIFNSFHDLLEHLFIYSILIPLPIQCGRLRSRAPDLLRLHWSHGLLLIKRIFKSFSNRFELFSHVSFEVVKLFLLVK